MMYYSRAILQIYSSVVFALNLGGLCNGYVPCDDSLNLTTDAPAVLDAPLTITAKLINTQNYRGPFYFSFSKLNQTALIYV